MARGVVPALEGRDAESDVEPRDRMTPGLAGEQSQGAVQFARCGWCRQQGADDREAQARPAIALNRIGYCIQGALPLTRRRWQRLRERSLRILAWGGYRHPLRVM